MKTARIAILATHPIQYQVPWFRASALCPDLDTEVLFCHRATPEEQGGAGFGVAFDWDIPLLDGYRYRFLQNAAAVPALATFGGLDTPEIKRVIASRQYDAVIVNGWHYKSAWQAIRACWATKTPVMVRSDSHLHSPRHPLRKFLKSAPYRWFIPKFDACLATGKWSTDYFLHYGASLENVFVVPHVIDLARIESESVRLEADRTELRRRWGLDSRNVVFLFAGKFISTKRPLDFVHAIAAASRLGAHISGLMVGDGPLRETCERLAKARNIPVSFSGFLNQSQIGGAYKAADVLVLPSEGETWGIVVNEAMANGRPCIVSDRVGCSPDLVIPGQTGFEFPVGNIEVLANFMLKCQGNSDDLLRMGQRARERANHYSAMSAVDGTLTALSAITIRHRSLECLR